MGRALAGKRRFGRVLCTDVEPSMRDRYHRELDGLRWDLARLACSAGAALRQATTAVLEADLNAAQDVVDGDISLDELRAELDDRTLDLIARQQPVAGDLRVLLASVRISADLERMGDIAVHIAEIAKRRCPVCAIPHEVRRVVEDMAHTAIQQAYAVADGLQMHDLRFARAAEAQDDEVDRLHRRLNAMMLELDRDWPLQTAIDLTLVGRYYERFADHTVSVARRLEFAITGEAEL
jgi:phosphate transport system protein